MTQRWNRCIPQKLEDTHWLHRFGKLAETHLSTKKKLKKSEKCKVNSAAFFGNVHSSFSLALLPTRPVERTSPVIFGRWSWRGGPWSGLSLEDYMPPLDVSSEGRGPMKICHEVNGHLGRGPTNPRSTGDLGLPWLPPMWKNIHQEVRMKERVYRYIRTRPRCRMTR